MNQWGEFQGRIEDNRLVTGQGLYVADIAPERTAHAVVVRAQVASASITSIDTAAALASPGVLAKPSSMMVFFVSERTES